MKILVTGDLHIGRFPTYVPRDNRRLSVEAVWDSLQQYAIDKEIDAVALTGDVVEHSNSFFEAYSPLRNGIGRLVKAGIDVIAVAGNHDYDVFPRLVNDIDSDRFHFLGAAGDWDQVAIGPGDETAAIFTGRSFTDRYCDENPLEGYKDGGADRPVIGLLHCDLDSKGSRYAPVRSADFDQCRAAAWLLGHIHAPSLRKGLGGTPILYPGSLQPLDPGEQGLHGPWIVEVDRSGVHDPVHLPMATVRYHRTSVDVTGAEEFEEINSRIAAGTQEGLERCCRELASLQYLVIDLTIEGKTRHADRLQSIEPKDLHPRSIAYEVGSAVRKINLETRPALDLEALAGERDPRGVIARLILDLEQGILPRELEASATQVMSDVHSSSAFTSIKDDQRPDAEAARRLMYDQATMLLDALTRQVEDQG